MLSAGISILRSIFSIFSGGKRRSQQQNGNPFSSNQERENHTESRNAGGEKVFAKDEGEYVDFEEYKEDETK